MISAIGSDAPHDPPLHAGPLRPVLDGLLRKDPAHRLTAQEAERLLDAVARQSPATPAASGMPPGAGSENAGVGALDRTLGPEAGPTLPAQHGASTPAPATPAQAGPISPLPGQRGSSAPHWVVLAAMVVVAVASISAIALFVLAALHDDDSGLPSSRAPRTAISDDAATTAVPDGYVRHDGGSFTALVPQGWEHEQDGRDWSFLDKTEGRRRGISVVPLGDGFGSAAQHLSTAAENLKSDYRNYRQISFREGIDYLGEKAAEVEFTFTENGTAGHARVRVFRFNGEFYMIMMIAFQSAWEESVPHFETFLDSFQAA